MKTVPRLILAVPRGIVRRLALSVSRRSRLAKLDWFRDRIPVGSTVLMVGMNAEVGAIDNIVETGLDAAVRACSLIYDPGQGWTGRTVRGAAPRLPFADGSVDLVISNAVLEHVGGPEAAVVMVAESRRVARVAAIHTTPYRWYPVETHSKVPLLHWLPRRLQHRAFSFVGVPWFRPEEYWLFDRRDLTSLGERPMTVHRVGVSLVAEWPTSRKA